MSKHNCPRCGFRTLTKTGAMYKAESCATCGYGEPEAPTFKSPHLAVLDPGADEMEMKCGCGRSHFGVPHVFRVGVECPCGARLLLDAPKPPQIKDPYGDYLDSVP